MSILDQYNKSQLSTNAVSDTTKNNTKYESTIVQNGSTLVKQVESTTLAPSPGTEQYTQQIFEESVK